MNLEPLADLASFPGTHDKDRYARAVRQQIRVVMGGGIHTEGVHLVLNGLLRIIDRRDPVTENQRRLSTALDVISTMTGVGWRKDATLLIDGDAVPRKGSLFSNPAAGQELVGRGVITGFDPANCTCWEWPEEICFAATHNV